MAYLGKAPARHVVAVRELAGIREIGNQGALILKPRQEQAPYH